MAHEFWTWLTPDIEALLSCDCRGAIPNDFRVLPERIILVRHAESEGNVDNALYTFTPDSQVPLVGTVSWMLTTAGPLAGMFCHASCAVVNW